MLVTFCSFIYERNKSKYVLNSKYTSLHSSHETFKGPSWTFPECYKTFQGWDWVFSVSMRFTYFIEPVPLSSIKVNHELFQRWREDKHFHPFKNTTSTSEKNDEYFSHLLYVVLSRTWESQHILTVFARSALLHSLTFFNKSVIMPFLVLLYKIRL